MANLADHQDEKVVCSKVKGTEKLAVLKDASRVNESLPADLVALGALNLLLQGTDLHAKHGRHVAISVSVFVAPCPGRSAKRRDKRDGGKTEKRHARFRRDLPQFQTALA